MRAAHQGLWWGEPQSCRGSCCPWLALLWGSFRPVHILLYIPFQCDPMAGGPQLSSGGTGCGKSEAACRGESISGALSVWPGTEVSASAEGARYKPHDSLAFSVLSASLLLHMETAWDYLKLKIFIFSSFVAEEANEGKCSLWRLHRRRDLFPANIQIRCWLWWLGHKVQWLYQMWCWNGWCYHWRK